MNIKKIKIITELATLPGTDDQTKFTITSPPSQGNLKLLSAPGSHRGRVLTHGDEFTRKDVTDGRLCYVGTVIFSFNHTYSFNLNIYIYYIRFNIHPITPKMSNFMKHIGIDSWELIIIFHQRYFSYALVRGPQILALWTERNFYMRISLNFRPQMLI